MVLTATTLLPSHISKIGFLRTFIHHSSFTLTRTMLESQPYNCNSFISTHIDTLCKDGRLKETLAVLRDMDFRGVYLDLRTYSSILQACTNMKALAEGKEVHAHILMSGLEENICLATTLISMYGVCQHLMDSRKVFDKICERNVFLWNAMISGYAKNNLCEQAMRLYCEMRRSGILPNNFTFPSALKVCASLSQGREIHDHIVRYGFESDIIVGCALVAMYGKYGIIEVARQVFDKMSYKNASSWNTMIAGYAQTGCWVTALDLFRQMLVEGIGPDQITVATILPVCSFLENLQHGKEIHSWAVRRGFNMDVFVGSALIDMYANCKNMGFAFQVFDKMSDRNVVSWTALIAGYAQHGYPNQALEFFRQMQVEGVKPNRVTIVSVLPVCANLAALLQGKEMHQYVFRKGFELDVSAQNALIDMYAKCGSLDVAREVFDRLISRDVVSWSAMIAGYGMHGQGEDALSLFYQMQQAGVEPDYITLIGVLSACSHGGLVDEGWLYFNQMSEKYGILPMTEHYACMVDLLGRAGQLNEAQEFIKKMPVEPTASVWGALLGACRVYGNLKLGENAFDQLLELEPESAGNCVLLSNIYAAAGRWDGVTKMRTMMKDRGLKKVPGYSWIVVKNQVHTFLVGDKSHPQLNKIHAMLENLFPKMKAAGYVPDFQFVLYDI